MVVGIDGTPLSEAAIAFAFAAAAARRVPLVAVHTWLDEINDPALAELVDWQTAAVQAEEVAGRAARRMGREVPGRARAARGRPRTRRAGAARPGGAGRSCVVVGSRGHGEIAGLLLDSVSNALVDGAACPVAIVRTK